MRDANGMPLSTAEAVRDANGNPVNPPGSYQYVPGNYQSGPGYVPQAYPRYYSPWVPACAGMTIYGMPIYRVGLPFSSSLRIFITPAKALAV